MAELEKAADLVSYAEICERTRRREREEFHREKERKFVMAMPQHIEDIVNEAKKMYSYHRSLNKHRLYLKEM